MIKKILVIDDDEEFCEEFSDILKDEGYEVSVAHNGIDGQALVENKVYDILFLDLKMPGLDGYSILEKIKKTNLKLKIIVITGSLLEKNLLLQTGKYSEREAKLLKNADGLLKKPVDILQAIEKLNELRAEEKK